MCTCHLELVIECVLESNLQLYVIIIHQSLCTFVLLFQMEAKVLMVHLLRTFHVTLAQDYKLEIGQALTIHPKGGVPCTLIECAQQA